MSIRLLSALFAIASACSVQPHKSPDDDAENTNSKKSHQPREQSKDPKSVSPSGNADTGNAANETGNTPSANKSMPAVKVNGQLSIQLFLTHAGDIQPPTTYIEVSPILQKCVNCHSPGQRSPNLSSFPFAGNGEETLPKIMKKISNRVNDRQNPMPPNGLLPINERKFLADWIASGYLELPPAPPESAEYAEYAVDAKWTIDNNESTAHWDGVPSGAFVQELGNLPVGTSVGVSIKVTGPRGIAIMEKTYTPQLLSPSGKLNIPVQALAVDTLPPVAGDRGEIRATTLTHTSANLEWTAAADAETSRDDLH